MGSKNEYNQDKILDDLGSLLEEINSTADEDERFIKELEDQPLVSSSFSNIENVLKDFIPTDGRIELKVSSDKLTVTATFYPPGEGGSNISLQMLTNALNNEGIKGSYHPEKLIDSILKCNIDKKIIYDLNILEGSAPVNSVPEHLILAKNITSQYEAYSNDNRKSVDYKEISQFIIVEANDFIGELKPEIEGKNGIDVYGEVIPFKRIKSKSPKLGKNLQISNGLIYSAISGKLNITEKSVYVEEVLIVGKDVDYHTGNISYPKDVIIKGEVADGFSIKAGGNLLFEKALDATNVICKGNLTVNYGIIGKRTSLVKTDGDLSASFIEHCKVYAGGNINISRSIMNSEIYTSKKIIMSKSGVIVGGVNYCTNGLNTFELGAKSGKLTEVFCGIDFLVQKKLEWVRDQNIKLINQFKKINIEIERQHSENQTELIEKRDLILKTMSQLQENARRLVSHLDKNEEAEIIVSGTVYPGVYIEICHVSCHIFKEVRHVRFYLDKEKGKVVSEKIIR